MERYFVTIDTPTWTVENPAGLFRLVTSDDGLTAEFFNRDNQWEEEPALLGRIFEGDAGTVEITAEQAEVVIGRWQGEPTKSAALKSIDDRTTAWLGLYLPADVAERLALPGGESPEALHMTVAYLGQQPPEVLAALPNIIADWAFQNGPVDGTLSGIGRFNGDDDAKDAVYCSVDAPALPAWRESLVRHLAYHGLVPDKTHGFTPHVTLDYVDKDDETPVDRIDPVAFQFDKLTLSLGDVRRDYVLRGPAAKFNPNHDSMGRFAEGSGSSGGAFDKAAMSSAVAGYLGTEPQVRDLQVLSEQEFDSRFNSHIGAGVTGRAVAITTHEGEVFINEKHIDAGVHELVHAAGFTDKTISTFVNEGLTQTATARIGEANNIQVRETYKPETAYVQQYILPVVGNERAFFRGYANAPDKSEYTANEIWKRHGDKFADADEWGRNPLVSLTRDLRGDIGGSPYLHYLAEESVTAPASGKSISLLRALSTDAETALKAVDPRDADEARLRDALIALFRELLPGVAERIAQGQMPSEQELAEALRKVIEPRLVETAVGEHRRIAAEVGVEFDPAMANLQSAEWARGYSFELVKGLTDTTRGVLQNALGTFQATPGMTRGELETLVRGAFSEARAENIAVTETTRSTQAGMNLYRDQLRQAGITTERVWFTVNDSLVCPLICDPLHGKPESEWVDQYPDGPPSHSRCRCHTTLRTVDGKVFATKYNPYHDNRGRFSSGGGATSVSIKPGGYTAQQKERIARATGADVSDSASETKPKGQTVVQSGKEALRNLRSSVLNSWQSKTDPEPRFFIATQAYQRIRSGEAHGHTMWDKGELVAIVAVKKGSKAGEPDEVEHLATKRRGYGTEMMKVVAKEAAGEGRGLTLEALGPARDFYAKLGFQSDKDDPEFMDLSLAGTRRLAQWGTRG